MDRWTRVVVVGAAVLWLGIVAFAAVMHARTDSEGHAFQSVMLAWCIIVVLFTLSGIAFRLHSRFFGGKNDVEEADDEETAESEDEDRSWRKWLPGVMLLVFLAGSLVALDSLVHAERIGNIGKVSLVVLLAVPAVLARDWLAERAVVKRFPPLAFIPLGLIGLALVYWVNLLAGLAVTGFLIVISIPRNSGPRNYFPRLDPDEMAYERARFDVLRRR